MVENEVSNEILLNIPLRKAKYSSRKRRADSVLAIIRQYVSRFTKSEMEKIWIDTKVNEAVWKRGRSRTPSHIQVKIIKLQEGTTEVILP